MNDKKSLMITIAMTLLGVALGWGVSKLDDYLSGYPIDRISENVDKIFHNVNESRDQLLREIEKLKAAEGKPAEANAIVSNIIRISTDLTINIEELNQYNNIINAGYANVRAMEKLSAVNNAPDFILPLNKATSLCDNKFTFSVISEAKDGARIGIIIAGTSRFMEVGTETKFDGLKKMVSYLGKSGNFYQFRLVCDYKN